MASAHLVLDERAARRWSGEAAPAAARWQRTFEASLGAIVPRDAFRPPPRLRGRTLVLHRR
jgi:16S rRNA A1518/A1519 N6-dimethyltransferase RsmA/KsgA/DIM1 with predicted DNA glycosylase/AP lyase activity